MSWPEESTDPVGAQSQPRSDSEHESGGYDRSAPGGTESGESAEIESAPSGAEPDANAGGSIAAADVPEAGPAARIAGLLEALSALDTLPLAEHADVYQQVHSELQSALAEIDGS